LENACKDELRGNDSGTKGQVGRPPCGVVTGVLPEYRETVIEQFIEWYEEGCFHQKGPTGMKALADFLYKTKILLSYEGKPLSAKTKELEISEVYRKLHAKEIKVKKMEKTCKRKNKIHNN
jgi:3-deoxy-D-manno-octulosonate 8-phosphate phosphatase KdsC-like HAD superfamily phosphatase